MKARQEAQALRSASIAAAKEEAAHGEVAVVADAEVVVENDALSNGPAP